MYLALPSLGTGETVVFFREFTTWWSKTDNKQGNMQMVSNDTLMQKGHKKLSQDLTREGGGEETIQFTFSRDRSRSWVENEGYFIFTGQLAPAAL